MRKKLLALLMCATMVLGTSVTAMASVTDDAKALGTKNAQKFIDEYYPTAKTLVSKTQNGTKGQVEYGYLVDPDADAAVLGYYKPVVVYSKDDVYHPATWVYSNAKKLKAYETKAVTTLGNTVAKVIASTSFEIKYEGEAADDKSNVYTLAGGTLTQLTRGEVAGAAASGATYADKDKNVIVTVGTNTSVTAMDSVQAADKAATAVAGSLGDGTAKPKYAAITVYDDNGVSSVMISTGTAGSGKKVDGFVTNTDNYVKEDSKKGDLVEAGESFIKTDAAFGKVYSNITKAGEKFLTDGTTSVEYALNNKVLTKDAVAVKVYSYVQGPAATENVLNLEGSTTGFAQGYAKPLYNYTKLQGGTYTFDSDLISRTGFKDTEAVAVFQPSLFATKFDLETGAQYFEFNKIAEVAVNDVITFDSNPTYVDGQVFIFDKGELAAEPEADKNDGVSDTTAPTTDNTTSPKTGDVAPIAALAVVMMGAFGAMVVASKKRA